MKKPPPRPEELQRFLNTLCANLGKAIEDEAIPPEWLCSSDGNRNYMLHSRVCGILAKTGFDLRYIVEVGAGFDASGLMYQFKPDVLLWDSDQLRFLIEYESTNSSDSRIIDADFGHCYEALEVARGQDAQLPDFWVVIYTLPDHEVGNWSHHDYPKRSEAFAVMSRNPHAFYRKAFERPALLSGPYHPDRWRKKDIRADDCHTISDCTKEARRANREVLLINLTDGGLEIDFPKRLAKKHLFKPSSRGER
ncbi:MAG: hypothetical protein QUS33_03110 [Dehalococcoidia bacterium]|nr:hypothetical protein [Dehalococcoidia bacterium]